MKNVKIVTAVYTHRFDNKKYRISGEPSMVNLDTAWGNLFSLACDRMGWDYDCSLISVKIFK